MIALLQCVTEAKVTVDGVTKGAINRGYMILACAEPTDTPERVAWLAQKIAKLRVWPDEAGKMNLSLGQVGGEILLVSQFTLAADTMSGHRPSFSKAAPPALGDAMVTKLGDDLRALGFKVERGSFGAHMQVTLTNDGPATFWLQTKPI